MTTRTLTPAQRAALISARDHGDPTHHYVGMAVHRGWIGVRYALQRRGLLDRDEKITQDGLDAIADADRCSEDK